MPSQDFLAQGIRAYGSTMQNRVADDLEQGLKRVTDQHAPSRDRVRSRVGMDPMSAMSAMSNLAQENVRRGCRLRGRC
jgi:polyhydroxyalkanoate synthesis regulator protein